jgi:hypothetical protein
MCLSAKSLASAASSKRALVEGGAPKRSCGHCRPGGLSFVEQLPRVPPLVFVALMTLERIPPCTFSRIMTTRNAA